MGISRMSPTRFQGLLLLIFMTFTAAAAKQGYLLTTHRTIIPGSKHRICIALADFTSDVSVYYEVRNINHTQIYGGGTSRLPAEGGCYELQLSVNIPIDEVELYVEKRYSVNIENYTFSGSTKLSVLSEVPQFTIIQTDKPVYMPSQTVRIRLVTLRYDLIPVRDGVQNVSIQNPLGFDIERWENVALSPGIVELGMKLAAEPLFGTYVILCSLNGRVERVNFRVLKYVLPQVELIQRHPENFASETGELTGEICLRYTFAGDKSLPSGIFLLEMTFAVVNVHNDTYVEELMPSLFSIKSEMRGCYRYQIPSKKLDEVWTRADIDDLSLLVRSKITEFGTGIETNGKDAFIKLDRYNAILSLVGEDTYMPGLPYEFTVQLQHKNQSLASHQKILVYITSKAAPKVTLESETNTAGWAFFSTTSTLKTRAFTITAKLGDETKAIWSNLKTVTSWFSPTGRYIKLRLPNDGSAVPCNRNLSVKFYYTTTYRGEAIRLNTQIIGLSKIAFSKSEIISLHPMERVAVNGNLSADVAASCSNNSETRTAIREFRGIASTTFLVTPDMSPSSKLLLFYISPDGEVVADVMNIFIKECTSNTVKLSFSNSVVRPGKSVFMEISAAAGSLCSYGVIDRSVELLANRAGLNISQVFQKLQELFPKDYKWEEHLAKYKDFGSACGSRTASEAPSNKKYDELADASYAFLIGKTLILTDLQVSTRQVHCCHYSLLPQGRPQNFPVEEEEDISATNVYTPSVNVRSYFPETWLWDAIIINDSGSAIIMTSAPHSMTSWQGTAMCIHNSRGFGISPVATLTTFQRFFLRVHMPHSAVRGESVPVVVKIHNYFSDCFMMAVSISNSEDFSTVRRGTEELCVCGHRSVMHVFLIKPRAVGNVNVTITSHQMDASKGNNTCPLSANMTRFVGVRDAVLKSIVVKLEGRRQENVQSFYVCVSSGSPANVQFLLEHPDYIVPNSTHGNVSVVGDILGHTIGNLKTLVELPRGCGEQTMIRFSSSVFSLEYLEATGKLSDELRSIATGFIKHGYQEQLKFRCADGAFSFYGNNICSSNMWLTAFVVKCFAHADHYVQYTRQELQASVDFIISSQRPDGCFDQVGEDVNHKLAAGIHDKSPYTLRMRMTAFIAISLLEAGVKNQQGTLIRAFSCLEHSQVADVYGHALMTYALSLHEVGSKRHRDALKKLWDIATSIGRSAIGSQDHYVYWKGDSDPMSIETTSYAILAILQQPNNITRILPAVKWLTTKRNALGGFLSTQDTVVAVQALSKFATTTFTRNVNSNVMVKVATEGWEKNFEVKDTSLDVQATSISQLKSGNLTMHVTGEGCAVIQANIEYNIETLTKSRDHFDTIVTSYSPLTSEPFDNCKLRQLHVCTKYQGNDGNASNMAIIHIEMVSGWTADRNSLDVLCANDSLHIASYEINQGAVSLHFTQIPNVYECFSLAVRRTDNFENVAPGYITTYEYYTHGRRHETSFTIKECSVTNIESEHRSLDEEDEDSNPYSDPSNCPTCYQPSSLSDLCQHRHVFVANLRLSKLNDNVILINGDLRKNYTQFQQITAHRFLESCECEPLESQDRSKTFFIAYTRRIRNLRTQISLYLSDENIYIFENKTGLEIQIIRQLQKCPASP